MVTAKRPNLKFLIFSFLCLLLLTGLNCNKNGANADPIPVPIPPPTSFFIKGADVSWVTQMENTGIKFYNSSGTEQECMQLLKNTGVNTIRLRVWVNPANGWCNTADVIVKATRAKNLGMKILIDFHYSDSWADPGQQTKPAAWAAMDVPGLQTAIYNHTITVMNTLQANGTTPDWVQVGNETNDGMLWPDGNASVNMANYATFFIAGYHAVKAVNPATKVMVHISNGYDNALFRWNLDGLKANGAVWDVIGMSLYPTAAGWAALNSQCLSNMNELVARYGSEVMVCEVGMSWDQPAACKAFITDLVSKVQSLGNSKGLGVIYWEPQAYNNWQGYPLGAFDNSGRPTIALDAFK
ncbi:MAG: glycosyl hydrolase 53 family protein [Chitinophagaceae bacterium]|nr:glycosyl hydrolase 53 family protein [Chitinophagaceae bacterium]